MKTYGSCVLMTKIKRYLNNRAIAFSLDFSDVTISGRSCLALFVIDVAIIGGSRLALIFSDMSQRSLLALIRSGVAIIGRSRLALMFIEDIATIVT